MPDAVRVVAVELLSWRDELTNVVRVGAAIVIGVWLYLATAVSGTSVSQRTLLPFQQLVRDRPSTEQRMFRELQEGLLEAEALRSSAANWPTVDTLASDGIPPFAPDPTARGARYRWQMLRAGAYVNYLGIPDQPAAPAWLVLVQEPDPGTPPDQPFEDEEHHKLLDGTMLHVSTWSRPSGASVAATPVRLPQAEGWTQIYAVGPGAAPALTP